MLADIMELLLTFLGGLITQLYLFADDMMSRILFKITNGDFTQHTHLAMRLVVEAIQ